MHTCEFANIYPYSVEYSNVPLKIIFVYEHVTVSKKKQEYKKSKHHKEMVFKKCSAIHHPYRVLSKFQEMQLSYA